MLVLRGFLEETTGVCSFVDCRLGLVEEAAFGLVHEAGLKFMKPITWKRVDAFDSKVSAFLAFGLSNMLDFVERRVFCF